MQTIYLLQSPNEIVQLFRGTLGVSVPGNVSLQVNSDGVLSFSNTTSFLVDPSVTYQSLSDLLMGAIPIPIVHI